MTESEFRAYLKLVLINFVLIETSWPLSSLYPILKIIVSCTNKKGKSVNLFFQAKDFKNFLKAKETDIKTLFIKEYNLLEIPINDFSYYLINRENLLEINIDEKFENINLIFKNSEENLKINLEDSNLETINSLKALPELSDELKLLLELI